MADAKEAAQPSIKATASQALGELGLKLLVSEFDTATCQVNLVKSLTAPSVKSIRYLDATKELTAHRASAIEADLDLIVTRAMTEGDGVEDFDFKGFADGRIVALPCDRFAPVKRWLDRFPENDKVEPLSKADNHASQLRLIQTVFTFADGNRLRVFRKSGNPKLASRKIIASAFAGTTFDYVDPGKSMVIDTHIDFFIWKDIIFVSDYKRFEATLDFRAITTAVATAVLDNVIALLPVTNAPALRAALLAGARNLNKIASLHNKGHFAQLEMGKIKALIDSAKLPLSIVVVGGVQTIDLDPADPAQVRAYVHILADDYVKSMLTEIGYIGLEKELLV